METPLTLPASLGYHPDMSIWTQIKSGTADIGRQNNYFDAEKNHLLGEGPCCMNA
jgi:hypothetical protein